MAKRKKRKINYYSIIGIIAILAAIVILVYGGIHGWFNINVNVQAPNQSLSVVTQQPSPTSPIISTCQQLCVKNNFNLYYQINGDCRPGEIRIDYGYPGQTPLLSCCCYNEPTAQETCTDSDGDNRDTVGHVTYGGETYYDRCLDVGQGVTEYICENGRVVSKNWACDYGEICMQTRSGGHCIAAPHVWNPGDTVFQGSGSGSIVGSSSELSTLNLADYGITTGGTCTLGAQIQTSWSYGNSFCTGLQGMEGLTWKFYDSNGLEYQRVDAAPVGLGIDLSPATGHNLEWDGVNNWRGEVTKNLNLPNCIINYEYQIRIYIYSCD